MKTYGLIGFPLSHSFSETYFSQKFKNENISGCEYRLFPISTIEEIPEMIRTTPTLCGLNVTIPFKQNVFAYLDERDTVAEKINAVNTISIIRNKNKTVLKGYNTDVYGFQKSLAPLLKPQHCKAIILGTGGAANAVKYVLEEMCGITDVISVSRTPLPKKSISYEDVTDEIIKQYTLIINTTPVGMYPDVNASPLIPYSALRSNHLLYDLVYNPVQTLFLKKGEQQGAQTKNGLEMLYIQAEQAWEIWNR